MGPRVVVSCVSYVSYAFSTRSGKIGQTSSPGRAQLTAPKDNAWLHRDLRVLAVP